MIRLKRTGRRHVNTFRICVTDALAPRDGREIEVIGSYAPEAPDSAKQLAVKTERAAYWLSVGAQPSQTVRSLLKKAGVALPVRKRKARRRGRKKRTEPTAT
jgi:small subunit ribosomal protein S16